MGCAAMSVLMMTSCGMREGEEDGRKEFKTWLQREREREENP